MPGEARTDSARVPPHNLEAERGLLGALLTGTAAVLELGGHLDAADFYWQAHAEVYGAIRALFEKNQPADLISVTEELTRRGRIEQVGGAAGLASLTSALPSLAHAASYAEIVQKCATRRRLIDAGQHIITDAYESPDDTRELLDRAEQAVFGVADSRQTAAAQSVGDLLSATMEKVQQYQERHGVVGGLPTGFQDLDDMTDGLHPAELVIVAARPSMGKTSLALNLGLRVAVQAHKGVAIYSLETSKQQITQNLLSMEAQADAHQLRRGRLGEQAYRELAAAAGRLYGAPLFIDDTPGITVMDLRASVRRLKKRNPDLSLVIIDYLQLMEARLGSQSNREQEVAFISRSLKALARELHIPVVALSQLNRGVEQRTENKPRMSDLRESGSLEQDADVILLLHREGYYNQAKGDDGKTEIIIAKQRNGPVGSVFLTFLKRYLRFEAWSGATEEQGVEREAESPIGF